MDQIRAVNTQGSQIATLNPRDETAGIFDKLFFPNDDHATVPLLNANGDEVGALTPSQAERFQAMEAQGYQWLDADGNSVELGEFEPEPQEAQPASQEPPSDENFNPLLHPIEAFQRYMDAVDTNG